MFMSQDSVLIIAEAGVNHNGCINNSFKLIKEAHVAGADYIKFQTFKTELGIARHAQKADYQLTSTEELESQFEMVKKLELTNSDHLEIINFCEMVGINFSSTAFDIPSIDFLTETGVDFLKIPSGEITNLPYLRHIASKNLPIVLSTGMATLKEVEESLKILEVSGANRNQITVLHCNTEYPTPMEDVNLNAMLSLKEELGVNIGYSDHTLGIEVPIAAVAMGATVIEKHFTLDRCMDGPDHAASLEPDELKQMVKSIRNIEKAMGEGIKKPSNSEEKNISIVRKSIVASKEIKVGDEFTADNLGVKRPGTGISPMQWDEVVGKVASKDFDPDELITI
jgi:N,N'-diacetyllegionaminate synthase